MCNQIEAEQFKEREKQIVREMNRKMDEKLTKLQSEKQKLKVSELVASAQSMREKYTSLIFKQRQLSEDDVDIMIGGRDFVPIETMEHQI